MPTERTAEQPFPDEKSASPGSMGLPKEDVSRWEDEGGTVIRHKPAPRGMRKFISICKSLFSAERQISGENKNTDIKNR